MSVSPHQNRSPKHVQMAPVMSSQNVFISLACPQSETLDILVLYGDFNKGDLVEELDTSMPPQGCSTQDGSNIAIHVPPAPETHQVACNSCAHCRPPLLLQLLCIQWWHSLPSYHGCLLEPHLAQAPLSSNQYHTSKHLVYRSSIKGSLPQRGSLYQRGSGEKAAGAAQRSSS